MKNLMYIFIGVMMTLGALYLKNFIKLPSNQIEENSTIVLEKIKKVAELTTVKGQISEIYNYKDYYVYDIWPLRKQALIRVRATVSIGYDLESLELEVDEEKKTIYINNIPSPSILSLDHDLDYYDMSEGMFNVFTNVDITELSQKAKEFIYQQAMTGSLYAAAEEQKDDFVDLLKQLMLSTNWQLEIRNNLIN